MIVVFTGNGKGKTTAALGAALRAVGRGQNVLMVQFIKGPWKSGEDFSTKLLSAEKMKEAGQKGMLEFKKMGLGFVGILGDQLPLKAHQEAAERALTYIEEAIESGVWNMVIMDEVNVAVHLQLVTKEAVLTVAEKMPEDKVIVLTGRDAPDEFIARADLVTEMQEIKHPFQKGKLGKLNVEF